MDRDDIFNTEKNTIYQKGFTPSRNRDWGIEKKKPDQSRIILASVIIIIVVSAGAALIDFDDPRLHEPDRIFRFFEQFSLPSFSVDIFSDRQDEEYDYIYGEGDVFYTKYLSSYQTDWESEDLPFGGTAIYLDRPGYSPFITIRRIPGATGDPGEYLDDTLIYSVIEEVISGGNTVDDIGYVEYVEISDAATGEILSRPQIYIDLTDPDGGKVRVILLLTGYTERSTGNDVIVQFTAAYNLEDEEEKEAVMEAFNTAVSEFYIK